MDAVLVVGWLCVVVWLAAAGGVVWHWYGGKR